MVILKKKIKFFKDNWVYGFKVREVKDENLVDVLKINNIVVKEVKEMSGSWRYLSGVNEYVFNFGVYFYYFII